ncbi:hypothetical protein V6B16_14900 [Salinimicrobium catena]|uniref:hypothetical protein n=1 Tax=Salinimicrobium catena TaxID=390640 RepID=UPI002FE44C91
MKKAQVIFTLLFLTISLNGYCQKQSVKFKKENFLNTIQRTFDSLKKDRNLDWIYYRVANFDTINHSTNFPPPPNFITDYGFTNVELNSEDFEDIILLKLDPEDLFEVEDSNIESIYPQKKKKFGNGLVFSLPYSFPGDKRKFIDIEIINWDYSCGTGKELNVQLEE